jgi:catechol 2,3-dioxygenase-like lactoylglutathione lyase family enzyme
VSVHRLNHVSLTVGDLDASLAFWHDALGLVLLGRGVVEYDHLNRIVGAKHTRIEWAELAISDGVFLELFRYLEPQGRPTSAEPFDPGSTHICLEVDGLDQLVNRIQQAGYETRSSEPVEIPFGDWKGFRDIYVIDPNGAIVELSEAPPEKRTGIRRRESVPQAYPSC